MYDGCLGLSRRPFSAVPQIDHFFSAPTIESARTTLARSIQRGEGAGLVIGPAGTGKTLLCMVLAEQFRRSFDVVMLSSGGLTSRRALFQAILYELGHPYRGLDEGEARLAVVDYLLGGDAPSRGIVLLVDEAHTLPLRLLDEVRLLTNVVRGGQPMVRLVLAGGPVLEERFASPKLDSFSQRLSARCYLEALNRTETEEYILSQIESAGGHGEQFFPSETCNSVFQATGGVPRLINQLCDHALLLAYVAGQRRIEPSGVAEAWGDLQQLPTPWSGESKREPCGGGVIEFGSLDDQGEPVAASAMATTLKISQPDEGPECGFGEVVEAEPVEQIQRIERLLAEADDEFQPAGSIGPEIELRFDDAADHPFQEEFEHEEIVSDRYAASGPAVAATLLERETIEPESKQQESAELKSMTSEIPVAVELYECVEVEAELSHVAAADLGLLVAESVHEWTESKADQTPSPRDPAPRRDYRRLFATMRKG